MATDVASMPNGNYAAHTYGGMDQSNFGYNNSASNSQPPTAQGSVTSTGSTNATANTPAQADISKDEVGWYFVEQYYTTLSRSPEKLYLFYNKRSQFVCGQETEKVAVCVGHRAIHDKITELGYQDCKVRVTNVDSQASGNNIVIQVIGEISNSGQPHKKFTQTFVLATQTNGYFVLNDIFRYLVEEEDELESDSQGQVAEVAKASEPEAAEPTPASSEAALKALTSSAEPAAVESDAAVVDKEIEAKIPQAPAAVDEPVPTVNGDASHDHTPANHVEDVPSATSPPEVLEATIESQSTAAEADIKADKPKEPEPSPASTPAAKEEPQPAASAKPAAPKAWGSSKPTAPKTWASLAASANRVATPITPATPNAAPSSANASVKSATPATPAATATSTTTPTPSAPAPQRQDTQTSDSQDEWTAVSNSHHRQQSKQSNLLQPETQPNRGYIKNVHESVSVEELRAELEKFGELAYLDIARQKNCAFVDFKTSEGYTKATQTPFVLNGEKLYVEERRFRPGSTPYIPRGQFQGGRGGRGGANGQGAPRGNLQQGGGRGGPGAPRGRGGVVAPRGRGQ